MLRRKKVLASIILGAALLVLVIGGTAFAQGPDQPTPPAGQETAIMETFWQSLADHFSVSVDEIHNAVADAAADAIQPLIDDGKIPQDRADELIGNIREGKMGPFFMPHRRASRKQQQQKVRLEQQLLKAAADQLNMEPREVLGEMVAGKTLAQVVEEHGGDADAVITAVQTTANAAIDKALANGNITQEQADKAKEKIQTFLDKNGLDITARQLRSPLRRPGQQGCSGQPGFGQQGRGPQGPGPQGGPQPPQGQPQ